ncbi:hypothetical protein Y1Q_0023266 [Alligator mississippiensis]|uniref:Uncharacterized protein n=1 Tax=Alligator mississippiensis TaxID=8496 RepID=A0A151MJ70_ALLMI|nr:hypothetical protein Y1Q_0023266 [Alligator mississippiensis]
MSVLRPFLRCQHGGWLKHDEESWDSSAVTGFTVGPISRRAEHPQLEGQSRVVVTTLSWGYVSSHRYLAAMEHVSPEQGRGAPVLGSWCQYIVSLRVDTGHSHAPVQQLATPRGGVCTGEGDPARDRGGVWTGHS